MQPKRETRIAVLAAVCLALGGCTVVHVHGASSVQRTSWMGSLQVVGMKPDGWRAVASEGVGIVPGFQGLTIGYRKEVMVTSDPGECRIVFIIEERVDIRSVDGLIKELELKDRSICSIHLGEML